MTVRRERNRVRAGRARNPEKEQQEGAQRLVSRRPQSRDRMREERQEQKNPPAGEEKKRLQRKGNRQIVLVAYCFVAVFLGMIGYLVHFMVQDSGRIINNPYNKRQELLAERVIRGDILSADGKVLAHTSTDGSGKDIRTYPFGRVFCHVVGRNTNSMTGLELAQCFPLLTSHSNPLKQLANEFKGKKNQGDTVVTTLDSRLQQTAYDALGSYKGAVVALEPSTGKILAMVSKPDYDPNTVEADWQRLLEDSGKESALLNRATQGQYPPGSTFKLITAIEYIRENPRSYKEYQYQCGGSAVFQGSSMKCYDGEVHGTVDLQSSLAHSCNTSFANLGTTLNLKGLRNLCNGFLFNQKLPVDFEYNKSQFVLKQGADTGEVIQTAIGQGKTMITPLQNGMVSAAIANKGEMMTPYLVDHIENDEGREIENFKPQSCGKPISKKLARKIKNMMKAVITEGTANSLSSLSYSVAGKTGSAEIDSEGTSHAWFVGFAPAENPRIAVSIVVEGAGTGSQYAVPIAREMFREYLGE